MMQQQRVGENNIESVHRQRVLRDRAEIERRDMMFRFGRNPGTGEYGSCEVACEKNDDNSVKVSGKYRKLGTSGSCGGTSAWRSRLRQSRHFDNRLSAMVKNRSSKVEVVREMKVESKVSTKRSAAAEWWLRKDLYRRSLIASASDSQTRVVDDQIVARWFACGWGGLGARKIGAAQVAHLLSTCCRKFQPRKQDGKNAEKRRCFLKDGNVRPGFEHEQSRADPWGSHCCSASSLSTVYVCLAADSARRK